MDICEKCGKKQINVLAPLLHAAITNDLLYEFVLLCYEDGISLTFKHILKLLSTNIISKITDTKIKFKTFSNIINNTDNEIVLNIEDINTSLYDEIRLYVRKHDFYAQNKERIHNKLYEVIFIETDSKNVRACICYLFKWLQDKDIYLSAAIIANINYTISSKSLIWKYDEFYDIITDEKNINLYYNKHIYRIIFNLLKHEDTAECKLSIPIIGKYKNIYKFIYYDYIVYNLDINKLKIIFDDEEFREYADNNYDDIIKKDSVLQAFKYVSDDYIKLDPVASRFFAENPNYIEDSADDSDDSASADTSVYADVD